jgi:hypothetical protein
MQPMPQYHAVPLPPALSAKRKISSAANLASEISILLLSASQDCAEFESVRLVRLAHAAEKFSTNLNLISRAK